MKQAIIMRGPLGVGKSTVAKHLATALHGCYIFVDEILSKHQLDEGEDGIPLENFIKSNDFIVEIANEVDCEGGVIIDGNFYYQDQMDDLVVKFDGNIKIFTLTATLETCLKCDAGRSKVYGEDATRAVYGLVSRVQAGAEVNTENQTESQVITEILGQLAFRDLCKSPCCAGDGLGSAANVFSKLAVSSGYAFVSRKRFRSSRIPFRHQQRRSQRSLYQIKP
jgi:cytidylate kinase